MKAHLILSDGTRFEGESLGHPGEAIGEVVFNTGMTGYQEILSDPSYAGQLVTFTYPLIGNYGINDDDIESDRIQPRGLIVREACDFPSNWRSRHTIDSYMESKGMVGIRGIDTRNLTKKIRSAGVTMGIITTNEPKAAAERLRESSSYDQEDFVHLVSTRAPYAWGHEGKEAIFEEHPTKRYKHTIGVLDCGLKFNILRRFNALGVRCIVFPALTPAAEILEYPIDGVFLSPGPGDPKRLGPVIETVRQLLGQKPMFGICLGNQLLCHAIGGSTYKLPFGHRGSNHPVMDLLDGTVTITSQNHGYAVEADSLQGTGGEVTQLNLNDGTVEGIRIKELRASSIQYHPEAAPGPWDSRKYFQQFVEQLSS